MRLKEFFAKKYIIAYVVIALVVIVFEVFIGNFSTWRVKGEEKHVLATEGMTDETGTYYTPMTTINGVVKNVYANLSVDNYDKAEIAVIMTDEGDKYEYITPDHTVATAVPATSYVNVYPCGDVKDIQIKVTAPEGTTVFVNEISVNSARPLDMKPVRMFIMFAVILFIYLMWTDSYVHTIFFEEKKSGQMIVTAIAIVGLLYLGAFLAKSDLKLQDSPWPHHKQYQQLAHSLSQGTVKILEQQVDSGLLEAENPYDTIALMSDGVYYAMDYAYYDGAYYCYFGIVPEVLFYYPFYRLTGQDMKNSTVIYLLYVIFVLGTFLFSYQWCKKNIKSIPYFYWLTVTSGFVLVANFVYLTARPDIYNIPIMGAIAFTMMGLGLWQTALWEDNKYIRYVALFGGSTSMALVAGCRPQFLLFSFIAILWFLVDEKKLLTKDTILDTVVFAVPYILVAALVCWYNYARFGNIVDFGATYSLTTNDMNHRGFNLSRLIRGLYSFFVQPASITTDFPFMKPVELDCDYIGRYISEYTFGGMLSSNAFFVSIIAAVFVGVKKIEKPVKRLVLSVLVIGLIVACFDINGAGVLYRYTCDIALMLSLAAVVLWMIYLDKGQNVMNIKVAQRLFAVCLIMGLAYSFMTFVAVGNSINLADDNRALYYTIATYFSL